MKDLDLQKEEKLLIEAQLDQSKFAELYQYYVGDVYRFTYSVINNQHDAEDITSQVFIEFYKKLSTFTWQNVSLKYWFFTTAKNLTYSKFKKNKEVEYQEVIHDKYFEEISFVDVIMNKDLLEKVKEEIKKLSSIEQQIINLRIWEGMQFDEIANIVELKLTTCKLKFYRAIEKVKKALEEKQIMHAIAFPFLFTAIRDIANFPEFNVSDAIVQSINKTIMSNTGNILTKLKTSASIKIVVGLILTVIAIVTIAGLYYQSQTKITDDNNSSKITLTATPTVKNEVSLTTTVEPTPFFLTLNNENTYKNCDIDPSGCHQVTKTLSGEYTNNFKLSTNSVNDYTKQFIFTSSNGSTLIITTSYPYSGVGGSTNAKSGSNYIITEDSTKLVRIELGNNTYSYNLLNCENCTDGNTLDQNVTVGIESINTNDSGFIVTIKSNIKNQNDLSEIEQLIKTLHIN